MGKRCDLGAVEAEPDGDVNGDGAVDSADILSLFGWIFGHGPQPPGRSDANGNGVEGIDDLFFLINRVSGQTR